MTKKLFLFAILLCALNTFGQSRQSVSILGDSYSTFEGFVEPSNNFIWYFAEPRTERTDVSDVTQTWWHRFITDGGYKLEKNNSFSGSTICNTGYEGVDYSDRSFITRMNNLGSPDLLLIFGATNDSWANSPIGEFEWEKQDAESLKSFRPALCRLLSHITKRYPNTQIIYLINDGLKDEITSSITKACKHYGVNYLQLKDIDKTAGHPNIHGMKQISDQLTEYVKTLK